MTKLPFKQHIADLAELLKQKGVREAVICPGSRNAPLMQVFEREPAFRCVSIVDERSAGYIALGMALETGRPTAVITTSGTAVLNLAPAVAEAFNQHVPLIILTGDRPEETPPQFTNQRINQANVFGPNACGFYAFPPEFENHAHLEKVMQEAADLLHAGWVESRGPVHFNLLFHEPLYREIPKEALTRLDTRKNTHPVQPAGLNSSERTLIRDHLSAQKKVLFLAGMAEYGTSSRNTLNRLTTAFQAAVIAENIANLHGTGIISAPELVLAAASPEEKKDLTPDLVVAMGGPIVSKRTRLFVQGLQKVPVVLLKGTPEGSLPGLNDLVEEINTSDIITGPGSSADEKQSATINEGTRSEMDQPGGEKDQPGGEKDQPGGEKDQPGEENSYGMRWKTMEKSAAEKASAYLGTAAFSNITAVGRIMAKVPAHTTVHLGNSGVIRYAQLEPARKDLGFQSNRGTSGIDGSLSTAVGAAMVSENPHLALLGDLSFMYDSNALWNRNFPNNLKIIVLNDKGGGIFRLLDGPDRMPFFEEFSVTHHPVALEHLAKAFGMNFLYANNDYTLEKSLDTLFAEGDQAGLLEVDTSQSENSGIFRKFYKSLASE